jgi:uncharacterized protein
MSAIQFLEAQVYHSRSETAENSFRYPILNVYFPLEKQSELSRLFKKKYFNILSINSAHYLSLQNTELLAQIKNYVLEKFNYKAEQIHLQTIPKMFGYVFNPVSFWYFHKNNQLDAVLCEVNNTFGEKHFYWLYQNGEDLNHKWLQTKKEFHVSPFFKVDGIYRFKFTNTADLLQAQIQLLNDDATLKLNTCITGVLKNPEQLSVFKILFKYGWMTPLVLLRIHYQAVKLFFKKVQFVTKPSPPTNEATHESSIIIR